MLAVRRVRCHQRAALVPGRSGLAKQVLEELRVSPRPRDALPPGERLLTGWARSRRLGRFGVAVENHRVEIDAVGPTDRTVVDEGLGKECRVFEWLEYGTPE